VRQALFKAVDGEENKWSQAAYSVFWSERVTVRKCMGCGHRNSSAYSIGYFGSDLFATGTRVSYVNNRSNCAKGDSITKVVRGLSKAT
jgi:hypothetical protein